MDSISISTPLIITCANCGTQLIIASLMQMDGNNEVVVEPCPECQNIAQARPTKKK